MGTTGIEFKTTVLGKEFSPREIIDNPSMEVLRDRALLQGGLITQFGNLAVVTKVRNRSAKFTEIIMEDPDKDAEQLIGRVLDYLKHNAMIQMDRTMCMNPEFQYHSRNYSTEGYARIPMMWGSTLFPPQIRKPDFVTISVPEWEERRVIVLPELNLTFILGTDYKGENKKAMLRLLMYNAKKRGCLGLHAGSKILRLKKDGELSDVGFIFFGLSGTGKTTLSCHSHWLKFPERVIIRQDDVTILTPDGRAIGTEACFYIKTDGLEQDTQPLLFAAALSPRAILENVKVHAGDGRVDFFDTTLTSNGRAMVMRSDIAYTDNKVDVDNVNNIIFITRRNDVVPPVARLNAEQGAAAFMLGESIETSAGDPTQAGKPLRVVGTNPFIVGSEAEEGNIFLDILRRNPSIRCYIMNTGRVGGDQRGEKITIRDSVKIIENIARGTISWKKDPYWGHDVPESMPDLDMERFNLLNPYTKDRVIELNDGLRDERMEWISRFDDLDPDIIKSIADAGR